ncbi:MAG TPA: AMP-binding protein [Thermomicrobiales bacterium]|nr:AMP-binding protein [Thermomicrobiales bacterium]
MDEQIARDEHQIVWRPSGQMDQCRLQRFITALGLERPEELQERAAGDPAWYWDAVVKHLGFDFHRPYTRVLETSRGQPWAEFFVDGGFNYIEHAVDRPAAGPYAGREALIWEGDDGDTRRLTAAELADEVDRFAGALRRLGIEPGDRVGLFLPMIPEAAIAMLACGKVGAIVIPTFSGYGAEAVAVRLRDADAKLLITADGARRRGKVVPMKVTADAAMELAPTVQRCVVVRRTGEAVAWNGERDRWWYDMVTDAPAGTPAHPTGANDPYMIIYTSGTTGRPKGAVHVHAGFPIKAAHDLAFCFDLGPPDRLLWLSDLGWMMGPWLIAGGLMLGATIVLFEGTPDYPEPDRLWQMVERHRVSVLGLAPTVIRALMPHGEAWPRKRDLSSLRILGSTGETWNPRPWRWYFDQVGGGRCPIINYSGGTETGGGIVGCIPSAPQAPCAFTGPVPGMAADVVGDDGLPLRGAVGELVVRQPWVGMTKGFWRDPERYLETYWSRFPDVWVHGDWAEITDDGFWYIRGRSDDTLNIAGKRIGPAEVESAAVAHPGVQEAAAIGVPHPVKGESAVVFVIARPGWGERESLAGDVRVTVASQLGGALRPEAVHVVSDLPRTRNAKIMRRIIRAAYLGQPLGDTSALENPHAVEAIRLSGARHAREEPG